MKIKEPRLGYQLLTKEKARIIAHLIGDGWIGQSNHDYNMKYEVAEPELLDSFECDLVRVYGLPPTHGTNPSGKTGKLIPFVRLRSKIVYEDLMSYADYYSKNWKIKKQIFKASAEIKIEFLKALFDDEGSVIPQGKSAIVRLYSININGLKQIQFLLGEFSIESKIVPGFGLKRNVYALTIRDIGLFKSKIGFNLQRKKDLLNKPSLETRT